MPPKGSKKNRQATTDGHSSQEEGSSTTGPNLDMSSPPPAASNPPVIRTPLGNIPQATSSQSSMHNTSNMPGIGAHSAFVPINPGHSNPSEIGQSSQNTPYLGIASLQQVMNRQTELLQNMIMTQGQQLAAVQSQDRQAALERHQNLMETIRVLQLQTNQISSNNRTEPGRMAPQPQAGNSRSQQNPEFVNLQEGSNDRRRPNQNLPQSAHAHFEGPNQGFPNQNEPIIRPQPVQQQPMSIHHLKKIEVPKFSGHDDPKTPYDFLLELEKYQQVTRCSEDALLRDIIPISLTGRAYYWHRNEAQCSPCQNFEEFKSKFRRQFQMTGYNDELMRALDVRTQGPTESLTYFIHVIQDFYARLDRNPSEEELIARVKRQMHPEYLSVLQGKKLDTLAELKEAAFAAQDMITAFRRYKAPPTSCHVEPSLAWAPTHRSSLATETRPVALVELNKETPRVHLSAVDPYTYFHSVVPRENRGVSFQNQTSSRTQSPNWEERRRDNLSPIPPRSEERARTPSPQPIEPQINLRRCFICQSSDHLSPACPNRRVPSPSQGINRGLSPTM
jgi:hypothetical protein